jgi:hypothetical protein
VGTVEEFIVELEQLLMKYGFNFSAGDMGSEIDLQGPSKILGYWEGSVPGKFVKW